MSDTRTFKSLFNQSAKWHPEKDAFVQAFDGGDRRHTYEEANEEARRFANALLDLGIEKGDRVAFWSKTTVEHAIGFVGATKAGIVPATIHERETPGAIASMINRIGATALVFQPRFADDVEAVGDRLETVEELVAFDQLGSAPDFALRYTDVVGDAAATEPKISVAPGDPGYILFSSGTTGEPKGVVHSHDEMVANAHAGLFAYDTSKDDVVLNHFTPSFASWTLTMTAFVANPVTVVFLEEWDVGNLLELLESEEVTHAVMVPTQLNMVVNADVEAYDLGSLDRLGYVGETMGEGLYEQVKETLCDDVYTAYGTSEMMVGTVLFPEEVDEETLGSIGRPVPSLDLRLIEPGSRDPGAEVDDGEAGELIVRGPMVSNELWDNPEKEREIFDDEGWFFTGDLAVVENDFVFLEGRADNMIISGGINIYAENVEHVLEKHPGIYETAVVGTPHETWGEAVKAFVVPTDDLQRDDLDEWCVENDELADYQRPREYEFRDELPRTNTGKKNRSALRDREVD